MGDEPWVNYTQLQIPDRENREIERKGKVPIFCVASAAKQLSAHR